MIARLTSLRAGLIVPLRAASPADAGGKAARLARLARSGIAVPDGWVLTLRADRQRRSDQLSDDTVDSVVRACVAAGNHPPGQTFAVRSSADAEDSVRASFAGQFRTELNVAPDDVPAAVRRVAASVHGPSARSYARRLAVPPPAGMAVLVQEQIKPVLAGVCFTAHPVTGADDLILEYASGLGDRVVSGGQVDGSVILPRPADGQCPDLGSAPRLPEKNRLGEVARLALRLEAMLGGPQDVEWAIDDRGVWVIQARPITTIAGSLACGHRSGAQDDS